MDSTSTRYCVYTIQLYFEREFYVLLFRNDALGHRRYRLVTHLELYHCRQITWPTKFRLPTLRTLIVEEATDSLILRLVNVVALRSLTVCNAASMSPGEFAAIGDLGPDIEELVLGEAVFFCFSHLE